MSESRKVRIAPTPSGFLHQGNLANFMLNARLAGEDGKILLRVDDLDRGRYRVKYVEDIFRQLVALGIEPTEGPENLREFEEKWSQQHRMGDYLQALESLRDHPLVYACPCSRKQLSSGHHAHQCLEGKVDKGADNAAWKINTAAIEGKVEVRDLVHKPGFQVDVHQLAPDFTIKTKDGQPSYQLACVIDDLNFGITHIGRGMDLLGSSAAQILLSEFLAMPSLQSRITFLHHPLITDARGEKLSKSAGHGGEGLEIKAGDVRGLIKLIDSWLLVDKY